MDATTPRTRQRGRRGLGSVYQRSSDGRWVGTLSRSVGGKRERLMVTAKTRDEAVEKMAEARRSWKRTWAPITQTTVVSVWTQRWLREVKPRLAPATWLGHEQHVRLHIEPQLGTTRLDRLAPKHVERMLESIVVAGKSARTANHIRGTLRVALNDAIRAGLLHTNAAALARAPKPVRNEMAILDEREVRTLIDSTRGEPLGPVWLVLAKTGIRSGEGIGLQWGDLDLDGGRLHVRRAWAKQLDGRYAAAPPKTEQSRRTIPLADEALSVLRGLREARQPGKDDPVFIDDHGRRLDGTKLCGDLRRALKRAGVKTVRVQDLRHTAASLWLRAGVDIVTVSKLLGHSNVTTTLNIYSHIIDDQKVDAVRRLEVALSRT